MQIARLLTMVFAVLAAACSTDENAQGAGHTLGADEDGGAGRGGPPDVTVDDDIVLDCVPGDTGEIHVVFACDEVIVYTCKDLSNIVLEFEDGQRVRFMGVNGHVNTFQTPGGERITGVWVKAGNNGSGDGPGYGERFDAPEDSCDDPPEGGSGGDGEAGGSGEGGESGSGGNGGDPCEDLDPDTNCDEGDAPPGEGEAGSGGGDAGEGGDDPGDDDEPGDPGDGEPGDDENGGTPQHCVENPSDPACMVD